MAKKSSSFLLRKSSKKKFNFYEEYNVLGSTFNYTEFFKQNLFIDNWLKYKLNTIHINCVGISYSKQNNFLNINLLLDKKYLLTNKELINFIKKEGDVAMSKKKLLLLLRWLKKKDKYSFNRAGGNLSIHRKFVSLLKYFYIIFFKSVVGFSYFFFYKYLVKYVKIFLFKFKIFLKQRGLGFYNVKFLNCFYVKSYLKKLLKFKNKLYKVVFRSFSNYFQSHSLFHIKKLNNLRWYILKNFIFFDLKIKLKFPVKLYFLNFNDYNFTNNDFVVKNYKKYKKYFYLKNLIYLHEKGFTNIFKFYRNINDGFYFFFNRLLSFRKPGSFLKGRFSLSYSLSKFFYFTLEYLQYKNLNYILDYFLKNFRMLFSLLTKVKYYYKFLNLLIILKQNEFWFKKYQQFYKDLKKNCNFFTTKDLYFSKLVHSLFFSFLFEKPEIFSKTLALGFKHTKKHHYFMNNVEDIVKNSLIFIRKYKKGGIKSVTIKVRGKFNGSLMRSSRKIVVGEKIKLQNIEYNIKSSYSEAYTFAGTFGLSLWYSF